MTGGFDDHLVGPNPTHFIIEPDTFPVQLSLYPQGRKFIGDYPQAPSGPIGRASLLPESQNFRGSLVLVSRAKGAKASLGLGLLHKKIRRSSSPLCRDNHPPARDRVFAQL
jgi:hypothetical protein